MAKMKTFKTMREGLNAADHRDAMISKMGIDKKPEEKSFAQRKLERARREMDEFHKKRMEDQK
jgi:hypothetical protein